MERIANQLGNAVTLICGLSCTCLVVLVFGGGILLRGAGVGLFSMLGDLIVGRVDNTSDRRTRAPLARPTTGAALRTQAQSLDFDAAVRQQGGVPMTIQAQNAAYPPQVNMAFPGQAQNAAYPPQAPNMAFPGQAPNAGYPQQGYSNTGGYTAQTSGYGPTLQNMPPMSAPGLPAAGNIQPLYDNRGLAPQEMRAQAAPIPNQPYPNAPFAPLAGAPLSGGSGMPSLSGQAPITPGYQPLSGGYQQQAAGGVDPNAYFPPPAGIPRRASLSAARDVSNDMMGQAGFDAENYPGLRNRRRRGAGQEIYDDQALTDREDRGDGGIGGIVGDLGNILGL